MFTEMLGIINNTLKPKLTQKPTKLKTYNTTTPPILLNDSKIWAIRKKYKT